MDGDGIQLYWFFFFFRFQLQSQLGCLTVPKGKKKKPEEKMNFDGFCICCDCWLKSHTATARKNTHQKSLEPEDEIRNEKWGSEKKTKKKYAK